MRATIFAFVMILGACSKKQEAPAGGSASGSGATGSSATGSAATPPPPPPQVIDAPAAPVAKTCADGDAAACVAEARKIAPTGAYRVKLTKEEADAKVKATLDLAVRACELNNGEGCALVAQYGKFAESDKNLAHACELGYVPSCGSVGRGLVDKGKAAERARAVELLEKACAADAVDWMSLTSHHGGFCHVLYELHGKLKDKDKAAKALERACTQGDKRDCPCKSDKDCGEAPEDMAGEFTCSDGVCDMTGG